jgi:hypothetical protein
MKLDGNPFPQNMIGFSVNMVTAEEKGKVKVLTSARAKQGGSVDPAQQVTMEQIHKEVPRIPEKSDRGGGILQIQTQGDFAYSP